MMYKTSHMHTYSGIIWQQNCPCIFLSCPLGVALSFLGALPSFFTSSRWAVLQLGLAVLALVNLLPLRPFLCSLLCLENSALCLDKSC